MTSATFIKLFSPAALLVVAGLATAGCNTLTGWFVVDAVTYDGSTLTSIEARFEQRCTGSTSVLHGKLRWSR